MCPESWTRDDGLQATYCHQVDRQTAAVPNIPMPYGPNTQSNHVIFGIGTNRECLIRVQTFPCTNIQSYTI